MVDLGAIRERLSSYAHEAWAGWMAYLFGRLTRQPDGSLIIPAAYAAALQRQIATPYGTLSEAEKDSDRREADRILAIVGMPALVAELAAAQESNTALRAALESIAHAGEPFEPTSLTAMAQKMIAYEALGAYDAAIAPKQDIPEATDA